MLEPLSPLTSEPLTVPAPVAVVMITLNESHNMEAVLKNLEGWAQEIFVVDSFSRDDTVDIALRHGAHVVQRRFQGFGDQWNFALENMPISAPWTMKLDPDERLTNELKLQLAKGIAMDEADGFSMQRRLWFMSQPLPIRQEIVRVWKTGYCRFSDVLVNEHPIVKGQVSHVDGEIEHHDSPDLEHWLDKQNRYSTAEAIARADGHPLSGNPRLFGSSFERRMWLKFNFQRLPFRYAFLFFYHWILQGAWRAGWPGYVWARLRSDVMRLRQYKHREIELTGCRPSKRIYGVGKPDPRVRNFD